MLDREELIEEVIDGYRVSVNRKKLWVAELDMLNLLEELCVKEDINYFLLFGSAIGAVRHKGFIPWDDDIDLGMLRDDFEKFLKADKSDWPEYVSIQYGVSEHGVDPLLRIRDGRTTGITKKDIYTTGNKGVFIEIYVFDAADRSLIRSLQLKATSFLQRCMSCYYLNPSEIGFVKKLRSAFVKVIGINRVWQIFEKICKMQNNKKDSMLVDTLSLPHYAKKGNHLFYKEDVEQSIYVPFEYTQARIPKGYDRCLSARYGAYMKLPPVEERGKHHSFEVFYDPTCSYTEYENSDIVRCYFEGDSSLEKL